MDPDSRQRALQLRGQLTATAMLLERETNNGADLHYKQVHNLEPSGQPRTTNPDTPVSAKKRAVSRGN